MCALQLNSAPLLISAIYYSNAGFTVSYYGRAVRYEVPSIGLVVLYDGWQASVTVPVQFAGLLQGICGNYDGNPGNDLTTADGVDVRVQPNAANLVGDSYVVSDPEEIGGTEYGSLFL
jgi:zonadhesin